MRKTLALVVLLFGATLFSTTSFAVTCPAVTYILSNNTTADANQVMQDFNDILNCANANLAPLANPSFTGNVGIGSSSPASALTIGSAGSNGVGLDVDSVSTAVATAEVTNQSGASTLVLDAGGSSAFGIPNWANAGIIEGVGAGGLTLDSFSAGITFQTSRTARMTLTSAGNIGIGTATPNFRLHVAADDSASVAYPGIEIEDTNTNANARNWVVTNGGNAYGALEFAVSTAQGGVPSYTGAKMTILSGGNVGIGTTSPIHALDVAGDIRTGGCLIYSSGSLGSCVSDIALKRDVVRFNIGLRAIAGLSPVSFYFNGLGGNPDDGRQQLGLIAQDVEKVAPQLVGTLAVKLHSSDSKPTTVKTVNYAALTYALINAVKELKAANDNYAAQLATLRSQVAELQRRAGVRTAAR